MPIGTREREERNRELEKVFKRSVPELIKILHVDKGKSLHAIGVFLTKVMKRKGYNYSFTGNFAKGVLTRAGIEIRKDIKKNNSIAAKKLWRKKRDHLCKMISEKWKDEEYVKMMSEKRKEMWKDQEYREKTMKGIARREIEYPDMHENAIKATKERWKDEEFRKKMSEKATKQLKEWWQDEGYRKRKIAQLSEFNKKRWQNEDYRKHVLNKLFNSTFSHEKLTEPEKIVKEILDKLGVKYTHNKLLKINNRYLIPDFVIGKKIIEVQGTFWHADPRFYDRNNLSKTQQENLENDREKLTLYKSKQFKVLYVWEYDIENNPEEVERQIKEFLNS